MHWVIIMAFNGGWNDLFIDKSIKKISGKHYITLIEILSDGKYFHPNIYPFNHYNHYNHYNYYRDSDLDLD